jgi:hypothetical protein
MPHALSFWVASSEYSFNAGASDTMESSEQHSSSSSVSSNSSTDQHSADSLTYIDATELQNSEAPTSPSEEVRLLISSSTSSSSEAIEIIANIISDSQVPWAFYVDAEAFTVYLLNRLNRRSQENEDEGQDSQNLDGGVGLETHINGTYGNYGRLSRRPGEGRERMLPRRGAVDYQFARNGEMS